MMRTEVQVFDRQGRVAPVAALIAAGGVLAAAGAVSRRFTPDPRHPRVLAWYERLEKPAIKPPDAVFGGIWPVLQAVMSYGAVRLMRAPSSPERNTALGLWAATIALVTGWGEIFFRRRRIVTSAVEAGLLVVTAAAFVERASRVDRVAALAGLPLALWSVFGAGLTADLARRNPRLDRDQR